MGSRKPFSSVFVRVRAGGAGISDRRDARPTLSRHVKQLSPHRLLTSLSARPNPGEFPETSPKAFISNCLIRIDRAGMKLASGQFWEKACQKKNRH